MLSRDDINKSKLAWKRILSSQKILLLAHLNPDVDALSSLGLLIELLEREGKDYLAFADAKEDNQYYLANEEKIIGNKEVLISEIKGVEGNFLTAFDLIVVLDCGSADRTSLGDYIRDLDNFESKPFIIEIDHHVPDNTYADIEIKIPLASTTELLYHFLDINEIEINRNIANCILAGILTDTGNFLYPSVSSKTLDIASEMMILGAQFPKLLNYTWRNKNFVEMKIWGLALNNLRMNKKYNIAFSVLLYDELKEIIEVYGDFNSDVFSDIAGFLSNLAEANITLLLREEHPGQIKASLRVGSSSNVDATKLAGFFSGGGHKKAAGFSVKGKITKENNSFKIE
jgi:bifunctional oligoribonuclease and PAP phosphatase NrnA